MKPTAIVDLREYLTEIFGLAISFGEAKDGELIVMVKPQGLHGMMKLLKENQDLRFEYLRCLCGVDYPDGVEIVYHLRSGRTGNNVSVKTRLPKDSPSVKSVTDLWAGADWHERETAELLGVVFEGHPDPRRLLTPDDFEGYPLRKDFKANG
jgi:NADH-quinone oxidoreductase subunit C